MAKRSGVIDSDDELAKLTLTELDAEIARCKTRLKFAPNSQLRKAWTKPIHWLERFRERGSAQIGWQRSGSAAVVYRCRMTVMLQSRYCR